MRARVYLPVEFAVDHSRRTTIEEQSTGKLNAANDGEMEENAVPRHFQDRAP